jgi:ADP-ribose pyrophosphatase
MENIIMPQRLDRKVLYESDFVCLYADKVKLPSGYIIEKYHQVHYPKEAVCVAIFNEKDEVLLIRHRRYTVGRLEWEIPAGKIEEGESPEEAARRECIEETGCSLKDVSFLCSQNPANGMSDCICHCFAARVDMEGSLFDTDEVAYKKWLPKEQVLEMLKNNETKDGVSMLGLLYAFQFYK